MNAIFLAILLTSATPSFEAAAIDGQTIVGPIDALTADRLTIAGEKGPISLATAKLLTISRSPRVAAPPDAAAVVVELTDGSTVHGSQYVASGDKARVTAIGGEVMEIPTRIVRAVLCGNSDSQSLRSEWAQVVGMKTEVDLLVVRSGDALDYHKGVIHDVTAESVRFDLDGEVLTVKRSKIYGLVYRRGPAADLPAALCRITDTSGSQWPVQSLALAAKLNWKTPAGLSVSQRLENVARIDFSGGKLLYLGDLKPESVAWTPFFAGRESLPAMKQFYAPRVDRGFDSRPLVLAKTEYQKGLAIQSRTELVYRLPERFGRFLAIAGIADAVRPGGKARLVIRGDDRVLFEASFTGSVPPRAIELDMTGVRRLVILVDFEAGLNVGSQLLLCNARVVK
jgi:hypothetical protein